MARVTEACKERVRDAVDMVDLVGGHTDLKRVGAGWMGSCPFHDERTGSFSVDPAQKLYHCFGCEAGGDAFAFVQATEGLDFRTAIEHLADRYGVTLDLEDDDPAAAARRAREHRLTALRDRAADFYERHLWESPDARPARAALAECGLGEEVLRQFRVGFAPAGWNDLASASRQAGAPTKDLLAADLVRRGRGGRVYDAIRGQLTFPVADHRGRLVGFATGDQRDGQRQRRSAPEHGASQLYGAAHARGAAARTGEVIVCDRCLDVLALHQAGLTNTVGTITGRLEAEHGAQLARLAPTALLAFAGGADNDATLGARDAVDADRVALRIVDLPAGGATEVRDSGELRRRLEASTAYVVAAVDAALGGADLTTERGRGALVATLARVLAGQPEGFVRLELLERAAARLTISVGQLEEQLAAAPAETGPVKSAVRSRRRAGSRFPAAT